jgi:hypothetical protein
MTRRRMAAGRFQACAVALLLVGAGAPAHAHVPSGYDLRAVHLVRGADGVQAYYRLTLPLVVARELGPERPDGHHDPAPFTVLRIESAHAFYYPDAARIRAEPLALGRRIADGHRVEVDGEVLEPRLLSVRAYPRGMVPPFNTVEEARVATAPGPGYPTDPPEVDAAYVVVDVHLYYPRPGVTQLRISSGLTNRVLGQPEIQTLLVDHTPAGPVVYRASGALDRPVTVNPSVWRAAATFLRAGIEHIASGTDHLLFVLCLALGATTLGTLAWRVTGFTLGHSVTLAAGALGYVPQAAWFPPAVETAIAISIVVAAVAALRRSSSPAPLLALTAGIGLLHGLGFSFALREMLQLGGPHLVVNLGAFNLGVETGQIVVAAAVWLVMLWLAMRASLWQPRVRALAACGSIVIATLWIVERSRAILAATS